MSTQQTHLTKQPPFDEHKAKVERTPRVSLADPEVIKAAGRPLFHERSAEETRRLKRVKALARNRRIYRQHKLAGVCSHGRCIAPTAAGRVRCKKHLRDMSGLANRRLLRFKADHRCTYCGQRPQFWGKRCIICRQLFSGNPLPRAVRRLIREYLAKEAQAQTTESLQRVRLAGGKLIADGKVTGRRAEALRLYVGLDGYQSTRSYREVGQLMNISGERVRQLLQESKAAIGVVQ